MPVSYYALLLAQNFQIYWFQDEEGEEDVSEDVCEEEETRLYPFPAKKKLLSVHIRPHLGNLSDYPYCITPQQIVCWLDFSHIQPLYNLNAASANWIMMFFLPGVYLKVIPAKGSGTIHVSYTPLTLSGSVCESRCVGLALGFMSLDCEVTYSIPYTVDFTS